MPYKTKGTLTTDVREVAVSETWDSQTEWEAFQSKTDIEITSGSLQLVFTDIPISGVSRWEFEQDLTDSWGDNNGADNTSAGYTTTAAVGSYAKSFDGTDDNVGLPADTFEHIGTGSFSISIWVKTGSTADQTIVYPQDTGDTRIDINVFQTDSVTFQLNDGTGSTIVSGGNISDSTYHMVTCVFDDTSAEMEIYVDETLQGNDTSNAPASVSRGNAFGYDANNNSRYFSGDLDDARTYDKALTATEVSNLYNTGSING